MARGSTKPQWRRMRTSSLNTYACNDQYEQYEQYEHQTSHVCTAELKGARCLNLCELQLILADQLKLEFRRNQPANSLIKVSYEYACTFAQISNRQSIFDLRSTLENHRKITEIEMASIVNLMPRMVDEAKAVIPSLNRLTDDEVAAMLADVEKFKLLAL